MNELTFVSHLALLSLLVLGLEQLLHSRPELRAAIAFEVRFALVFPLVFLMCVILWATGAMRMERRQGAW